MEKLPKAFIDDMSSIGISSDGNLCPWSNQEANQQQPDCRSVEPGMLHLHQIKKLISATCLIVPMAALC
jgi:hypothetical protein